MEDKIEEPMNEQLYFSKLPNNDFDMRIESDEISREIYDLKQNDTNGNQSVSIISKLNELQASNRSQSTSESDCKSSVDSLFELVMNKNRSSDLKLKEDNLNEFIKKNYQFDSDDKIDNEEKTESMQSLNSPELASNKMTDSLSDISSSTFCCENNDIELETLKMDKSRLIKERNRFKNKYETYKDKYKRSKNKLNRNRRDYWAIQEKNKSLIRLNDELAEQIDRLEIKLDDSRLHYSNFKNQLDKMDFKNRRLNDELLIAKDDLKEKSRLVNKLRERNQTELEKFEQIESKLKRQIRELTEKLAIKTDESEECENCLKLRDNCDEFEMMYKKLLKLID